MMWHRPSGPGSGVYGRACQAALDIVQARLLGQQEPLVQLLTSRSYHSSPSTSLRGACSPQHEPLHAQPPSSPVASQAQGRDMPAQEQQRGFSNQPEHTVYSGPKAPGPQRVTLRTLRGKYARGEPLTMVTAYDYPSAVHVDAAGLDILLVGDSVAMVVHGHDTTLPVTLDEMLVHCRAASRGSQRAFKVGDLPFGSYETSPEQAVCSAVRMMKEGAMDAVKLEGGGGAREAAARAIVAAGVACMGHVGLMPQSISVLGGFRPHGQSAAEAVRVMREAQALQAAGCFAVVLECVPPLVAACVTRELGIPTIGIGAGPHCSGQVLVYHDLLGMMQHPHHAKVTPKFCKQYAAVGAAIQEALQSYAVEVSTRQFPGPKHSPYKIADAEIEEMERMLRDEGFYSAADAVDEAVHGHRIYPISE